MRGTSKFANAIAEAATHNDYNVADPSADWSPEDDGIAPKPRGRRPQKEREAQAEAEAAFQREATKIREKYDVAVIWDKPRISRKRSSAEYEFWKAPIMAFIERPETLDLGPTELARRYAPSEPSFAVTKDTFRAPLSQPARKAARALLKSRGLNLKLPVAFTIRDVQKAMIDHRDRAKGIARFKPVIEIIGDTIYRDGKSFKMQAAGPDKKRIRVGNGWLSIERLTTFLSGPA